ncbi:MAG TPA: hypothetical protein VG820_00150 [Fimbriimonadaceae bacterium]|nr:hypothetical protein [Fimbriimonadaceae bacterium]
MQPQKTSNLVWILCGAAALVVCFCGVGGLLAWRLAYGGRWSGSNFSLVAFWPVSNLDPVKQADHDMERLSGLPRFAELEHTVIPTSFQGRPACSVSGNYTEDGRAGGFRMLYFLIGEAIYYLRMNYWKSREDENLQFWDDIVRSVELDPATRQPSG